ncbi:MAG: tetratricopeptide repeat protein [Aulosira sp. DedQUE10]|nr:tetratricopeptide repeat protein [Aulosira sp. DedQUE10]
MRSLGNSLQLAGGFEESQQVLQQSINIAQNLKLPQDVSIGEFSWGNTKRAQGNFESAIASSRS